MPKKDSWKIVDLLKTTTQYFTEKKIENPRLNAELLLADILHFERIRLYVDYDRPLSESELNRYRKAVARRAKQEPLQYIIGQTEFMGLPFHVSPNVLIPRPETEILCETLLQKKWQGPFLEIGTGSGCIAISLAHSMPESTFWAMDICAEALSVAQENSTLNNTTNITFVEKDLFSNWPDSRLPQSFTCIISNPPYIAEGEMHTLDKEVEGFEPHIALTDFADGLRFYKAIFELVKTEKVITEHILLEMSGSQPEKIISLAQSYGWQTAVTDDLTGIKRVLHVTIS